MEDVWQKHLKLRQDRLNHSNLITVASDQVAIIQALERNESRINKRNLSDEENKKKILIAGLLIKNHNKNVGISIENMRKHTELVNRRKCGMNFWMYLLELEMILADGIENCYEMLDVARAVKLVNK
jgi:hypothetical protein